MVYIPYNNLKKLVAIYTPAYMMSTIKQVWQLIHQADSCSVNLNDTYLLVPIVKHH